MGRICKALLRKPLAASDGREGFSLNGLDGAFLVKLESTDGTHSVYLEHFQGREIRARTVNGEAGARRIFDIIKAQHGVAKSPALRLDEAESKPHR